MPLAQELARQLEANEKVYPILWLADASRLGRASVERISEVVERSDFAIVILTADSTATDTISRPSHRDNLIFEIGLLAGRLGLSRTFVVVADPERAALPVDLAGAMYLHLSHKGLPNIGSVIAPAAKAIGEAISELKSRRDDQPVKHYSCFLSYSWKDREFAARLHNDLEDVGVRSWLDANEIDVGARSAEQIEKVIQAQDKVLLILSQASIGSLWVRRETKHALRLEQKLKKTVLFPIRLDDTIFDIEGIDELGPLKHRQISDFRDWQNKRFYQRAFSQLVRDFAISASAESERR